MPDAMLKVVSERHRSIRKCHAGNDDRNKKKFLVPGKRRRTKELLGRMAAVSSRLLLRLSGMIGHRSSSGASMERIELIVSAERR